MKNERTTIVATGVVVGIIASMLVYFGNPANMGYCIACFLRDTAGGLGLHSAKAVQYIRPEIAGLVLGALAAAYAHGEFAPKGGSSPLTRFALGFFAMIGCLMFLGCPFRMLLRLAGGDLNALAGLVGFTGGIYAGIFFLNRGYSLKRTYKMTAIEGSLLPIVALALLALLVAARRICAGLSPCGAEPFQSRTGQEERRGRPAGADPVQIGRASCRERVF